MLISGIDRTCSMTVRPRNFAFRAAISPDQLKLNAGSQTPPLELNR
jgi:hypothetical protein